MLLDTQELLVANIDSWMQEHLFLFYPRLLLVTKCWYQPWHVYLPHIQVNLDPYSYPANFNFHPCLLVTIFFSTEYIIWQLYQRIPTKSAIVVLSMQPIVVVDLCMNLNKDELPDTSADLTTENDQLGKVLTHNLQSRCQILVAPSLVPLTFCQMLRLPFISASIDLYKPSTASSFCSSVHPFY